MDFNFLGVCFIDDELPQEVHDKVNTKMEELQQRAKDKFYQWLDKQDLEQEMGVIICKQTTK